MKFPTLYKKTSTGAIQEWTIESGRKWAPDVGAFICTVYGQHGGKLQRTSEDILRGKNIGKKNETTPEIQAHDEAKARWEKKKKSGYVESIESAKADELDDLIEGGIVPMLAHKFSEYGHKIKYPCYAQPKLDGIRCIAILKDGACTLWSRTRKPITGVPHINREVERLYGKLDITLDGELYNHNLKKDFEKIVSVVRQEEPQPGHEIVQYHIYDVINGLSFGARHEGMAPLFKTFEFHSIKLVQTEKANTEEDVMVFFDKYRAQGYEGAMLRNADSKYVNKRSMDLQKVKDFLDDEFDIVDIEEGRGKLAGHVGAFICKMSDGKTFKAKMSGDTEHLKDYFENHQRWSGMRLTVQYQGLTSYGIPRFPVGKAIRNYE